MDVQRLSHEITAKVYLVRRDVVTIVAAAEVHSDEKIRQLGETGIFRRWLKKFDSNELTKDFDELSFSLSQATITNILMALAPQEALFSVVSELIEKFDALYQKINAEQVLHNHHRPQFDSFWYLSALNTIAKDIWWGCLIINTEFYVNGKKEQLLVVYGRNGFPLMKCKFLPRHGLAVNVFDVVENNWRGAEADAWSDWTPGTKRTFEEFVMAIDRTRSIANSKYATWDDQAKIFVPKEAIQQTS